MLQGVSKQAGDALKRLFKSNRIGSPVVTIAAGPVLEAEDHVFGVGVYEKENLGDEHLLSIDEFDFYIDPKVEAFVRGKCLDLDDNGNFCLVAAQPGAKT